MEYQIFMEMEARNRQVRRVECVLARLLPPIFSSDSGKKIPAPCTPGLLFLTNLLCLFSPAPAADLQGSAAGTRARRRQHAAKKTDWRDSGPSKTRRWGKAFCCCR
eukprot:765137-Hanusia_phi.AAC.1